MRVLNDQILNTEAGSTFTSEAQQLEHMWGYSLYHTITDTTPSGGQDFLAGEVEIQDLTFPAKAGATAGDHVVLTDGSGVEWAISLDVTGSDAEPTASTWTNVAAGRKTHVDISSGTDAASVAALVETAFDALTDVSSSFTTDDTAADGTMLFTCVVRGPCADPVPKDADGGTAGSITASETNAGVASTVDVTENTITQTAHGFKTGLKGQFTTTGTLPAGLSTSTDYWLIVVDDDTYQVASTLANALAGTAINITDQGADGNTHTFTATALAGTVNYQASLDNETWVTLSSPSANAFTGDESAFVNVVDVYYNFFRLQVVLTAGQCSATARINAKGV